MAIPTSPIDICNLALDRLGQDEIASIVTPTTPPEDNCARNYDPVRRLLLRKYIFNFAKKLRKLNVSATFTPAFGYASAYKLPNDFVRLLALGNIAINDDINAKFYDFEQGHILTDQGTSGVLSMSYIFDTADVNTYDPAFVEVFKLTLAKAMAYKFTLKNSFVKALDDELVDAKAAAAAVAGQEKPPRRIERSRMRQVRRAGIFTRGNTRV